MSDASAMRERELRLSCLAAAMIAGLFWALSLFAIVRICALNGLERNSFDSPMGWAVLALGWLIGPVSLSIAWYANIPLLVCIGTLFRGRVPNFWLASASLGLALTGLLPLHLSGQWSLLRGLAVWCWLGAFAAIWIPAAFMRWPTSESAG